MPSIIRKDGGWEIGEDQLHISQGASSDIIKPDLERFQIA